MNKSGPRFADGSLTRYGRAFSWRSANGVLSTPLTNVSLSYSNRSASPACSLAARTSTTQDRLPARRWICAFTWGPLQEIPEGRPVGWMEVHVFLVCASRLVENGPNRALVCLCIDAAASIPGRTGENIHRQARQHPSPAAGFCEPLVR